MKANNEIIKSFINGISASNRNLRTDGNKLINYYTTIAQRNENGEIIVNSTKYSVSTSKIQSYLRYELSKTPLTCLYTTKHVPLGTYNIERFV